MAEAKLYLYPKWLRIWHGINAISILMLIITGISMQYSNVDYPVIKFELAVPLHNIFGIITVFNYLFYFVFNFLTGNIKAYAMNLSGLMKRLFIQSKYYMIGYFKGDPKPFPISKEQKFNPLQRVAYVVAMYVLVPLVVITGVALLFPDLIIESIFNILRFLS